MRSRCFVDKAHFVLYLRARLVFSIHPSPLVHFAIALLYAIVPIVFLIERRDKVLDCFVFLFIVKSIINELYFSVG